MRRVATAAAMALSAAAALAWTAESESPGGRVAYARLTEGYWQVWVYDVGGDSHRQVTRDASDKRLPVWGPGGAIAFRSRNDEVYQIGADGGAPEPLAPGAWPALDPRWSPDGRALAVARLRTHLRDASDLWIMDGGGPERRVITRGPGLRLHPAWSPDGDWLAYVLSHGSRGSELRRIRPDGSESEVLMETSGHVAYPAWSPDGRALAYAADAAGDYEIYVRNVPGGDERQVTRSPGLDTRPAWSPDGERLAFTTYRRGRMEIWVRALDGGEARPLFEVSAEVRDPAWD